MKKSDGTYRVCINFKELNKITVFDPEPMMSPDDIFPKLAGSQYYSTFDFSKGYWPIPMEEKSKDCTSFITSRGLMRFKVMPFGMVNSGSTYKGPSTYYITLGRGEGGLTICYMRYMGGWGVVLAIVI